MIASAQFEIDTVGNTEIHLLIEWAFNNCLLTLVIRHTQNQHLHWNQKGWSF